MTQAILEYMETPAYEWPTVVVVTDDFSTMRFMGPALGGLGHLVYYSGSDGTVLMDDDGPAELSQILERLSLLIFDVSSAPCAQLALLEQIQDMGYDVPIIAIAEVEDYFLMLPTAGAVGVSAVFCQPLDMVHFASVVDQLVSSRAYQRGAL